MCDKTITHPSQWDRSSLVIAPAFDKLLEKCRGKRLHILAKGEVLRGRKSKNNNSAKHDFIKRTLCWPRLFHVGDDNPEGGDACKDHEGDDELSHCDYDDDAKVYSTPPPSYYEAALSPSSPHKMKFVSADPSSSSSSAAAAAAAAKKNSNGDNKETKPIKTINRAEQQLRQNRDDFAAAYPSIVAATTATSTIWVPATRPYATASPRPAVSGPAPAYRRASHVLSGTPMTMTQSYARPPRHHGRRGYGGSIDPFGWDLM